MDTKQIPPRQRRRFSAEYKREVVEETLKGAESVSIVARRHDLNTNLLFTWRRQYQNGAFEAACESEKALVPIEVASPPRDHVAGPAEAELEFVLAQGHRLYVRGAVDPVVLRAALEVLSR